MEQNESEITAALEKGLVYLLAQLVVFSLKLDVSLGLGDIVTSHMCELALSFFSSMDP
jgi:hypothetical protein